MKRAELDVVIREATISDVPSIHALQQEWESEGITYGQAADDPATLVGMLGPFCLVAEVDGAVVGYVTGTTSVSDGLAVVPEGEKYFEIVELYVDATMRGHRIGGRLLESALDNARRMGIRYALVYSATKDVQRIFRFYEEHGFHSWFVQMYRRL